MYVPVLMYVQKAYHIQKNFASILIQEACGILKFKYFVNVSNAKIKLI